MPPVRTHTPTPHEPKSQCIAYAVEVLPCIPRSLRALTTSSGRMLLADATHDWARSGRSTSSYPSEAVHGAPALLTA